MSDQLRIPLLPDRYIDTILRRRWTVLVIATLLMVALTGTAWRVAGMAITFALPETNEYNAALATRFNGTAGANRP